MKKTLAKMMAAIAVLLLGAFIYLDAKVQYSLNERQWQLPARVYARSLLLQAGAQLEIDELVYELNLLGYNSRKSWRDPGYFRREGNALLIHSRAFQSPAGKVSGVRFRVEFSGGKVSGLSAPGNRALQQVLLEPVEIGSIYPRHREDRLLVQLEQVPQSLVEILLLIEDRGFYDHYGISLRSVGRALIANIEAGRTVQGGSTITQQLVKNIFLTQAKRFWRKGLEAIMALQVELHYDKKTILESYINEVYLGQEGPKEIHGFALASKHYFNRPLEELNAGQIALLVGMVKGPSYYDPWRNPERAATRRNVVLSVMAKHQLISQTQLNQFENTPIKLAKANALAGVYPAYIDLVRRQLRRDYSDSDLQTQGMKIYTAFDPIVQRHAEQAMSQTLEQWQDEVQAAMVVTRVGTGDVLAVVGGRRMRFAGFNRAIDAVRPVGSLIKPAVYLTALEQANSYTLATSISDASVQVVGEDGSLWEPKNFDRKEHGDVLLHRALANSYNQATARLGMQLGLNNVVETLERLGVTRQVPALPAILLGAIGLSPMEVTGMYQTIASHGVHTPLRTIVDIADHEANPIARYPVTARAAFDSRVMHLLHYSMMEVVQEGTGKAVYQQLPKTYKVAGKTGTSNDLRDSWFAGFGGDYLAVVWLGRDDNKTVGLTGSSGALKVWRQFMAVASHEPVSLQQPPGIVYQWVDEASGKLSRSVCDGARYMPFLQGTAPTERVSCEASLPGVINWFRTLFK
jgi:penicillin-binding protein 1B